MLRKTREKKSSKKKTTPHFSCVLDPKGCLFLLVFVSFIILLLLPSWNTVWPDFFCLFVFLLESEIGVYQGIWAILHPHLPKLLTFNSAQALESHLQTSCPCNLSFHFCILHFLAILQSSLITETVNGSKEKGKKN